MANAAPCASGTANQNVWHRDVTSPRRRTYRRVVTSKYKNWTLVFFFKEIPFFYYEFFFLTVLPFF